MPPTGSQPSVADDERAVDHEVITLLLGGPPWIWTVEDLAREIGEDADVPSSITRLQAAGLLHGVDGAVFATRAAHVAASLGVSEAG